MAQRDYLPKLSEIPIEVDEDEETIKIVQLVKSSDPTGEHKSSEPIVVSKFAILNEQMCRNVQKVLSLMTCHIWFEST